MPKLAAHPKHHEVVRACKALKRKYPDQKSFTLAQVHEVVEFLRQKDASAKS